MEEVYNFMNQFVELQAAPRTQDPNQNSTPIKFRAITKVNSKSLDLEFHNRFSSSEPPRSRTRVDVHSKKQVTISPFRRKLCLRRLGFGALTVQTSVDIAMPLSSLAMAVHWSLSFCEFEFRSTLLLDESFDLLACSQLINCVVFNLVFRLEQQKFLIPYIP